jgi:hypothetical protein
VTKYDLTGNAIYFSTVIYSPSGYGVIPSGVDVYSQLSVAPNTANASAPVTFTATLTGVSDHPTPTGTVNFLNGAKMLGSGTLDANGVATFSSTTLAPGVYSITAAYPGGAVYSSERRTRKR